ncbi:phytanoyl-CoA dioxygenase family protein [Nocardia vinacea]|uniref:phytanoyl-CoA dioxygenase family protein n=1 Tax=Nocardia vinacea TaxID=96468 RepID=UPI002E0E45BF|nr:phytanoyl-CoA dioxygenase family protein [Nocardia vinacea]
MSHSLFHHPYWLSATDCDFEEFCSIVERPVDISEFRFADRVERRVLIYGEKCNTGVLTGPDRLAIQAEIARALGDGPGIVVFKHAYEPAVLDRASTLFFDLIDRQKTLDSDVGDHFGSPGSNDRLWSAVEKLAVEDAELFCDYFSNDVVAMVSAAWLGPNYQIVSEPNSVNPGSPPQVGHRDYHLGLMDIEYGSRFPAHVHRFSSALTLQAAVAHVDMPIETGPTRYLPNSQKFDAGFLAINLPDFRRYFEDENTQLSLEKGDIVFFNPAVIHGAGENSTTDVKRMANLLQISSGFARAAATVDNESIVCAIYPALRKRRAAGNDVRMIDNILAAAAEGYPFPTNLDRDRPIGSLFPESQLLLVKRALDEDWDEARLVAELAEQAWRRRSTLSKDDSR